jgi:signal transduction histidine kinase
MRPSTRSRLALGLWLVLVLTVAAALTLAAINGSLQTDPAFLVLAVAMIIGYGTVGAFIVARTAGNTIGWLMMVTAGAYVLAGLTSEYAIYAYVTSPGSIPGGEFAAWLSNWLFLIVFAPIPIVLVLFPTGRPPSPRWKYLPAATIVVFGLGILGTILRTGPIEVGTDAGGPGVKISTPTGVAGLQHQLELALPGVGILAIAVSVLATASLVIRFRRAAGDERQQIRWLAYVAAISVALFVATLVSSIGLQANQSRPVNDILAFGFSVCIGIGVPWAAGVAILKYRLWDLDIVLKKAAVAAVLVILIIVAALVLLGIVGGIVVGPLSDNPAAMLLAGLALGLLFWPLRRVARLIADRLVYGRRATPYEVLTEFSERLAETYSTQDVLLRMANVLHAATGAATAIVWLRIGPDLRPAAWWPAEADAPRALRAAAGSLPELPGDLAVEVRDQGELLGALVVAMPANDPLDRSRERVVQGLAGQAGLVLRNVRLIEELRASRQRLVKAQDDGRRTIERNIHDGAQQQLVALAVKLRLADSMMDKDAAKAHDLLGQIQQETNRALQDLRDLARGIYPPLLADKGLAAAVEAQARKSPVPVAVEADGIGRFPQEIEAAVYFCVLEGLQNALKHANPTLTTVRLAATDGHLTFQIADDGRGFDTGAAAYGTGLQGMADRLDAIGGTLEVTSAPGRGTTVTGRLPVRTASYDAPVAAAQADSSRSGPKADLGM